MIAESATKTTQNSSMVDLWTATKPLGTSLYLLALVASLIFVLTKIPQRCFARRHSWVLPLVSGLALYFTCKVKLSDGQQYTNIINWLNNSDPLVKTHWAVEDHTVGLWWTCQLFMFALTFVGFLNAKARHIDMSVSEMSIHTWLCLSGAIGISFPLFLFLYFGNMELPSDKSRQHYRLPTWGFEVLGVFLWLAYWSIASLPLIDTSEFQLYLFLACLFLILPSFIPPNPLKAPSEQAMMLPLYLGLVVLNTCLHWFLRYRGLPEATSTKLDFFATSSNTEDGIFVDCFFSFVVCCLYIVFTFNSLCSLLVLFLFVVFTPFLSLGASFAAVLGYEVYLLKSTIDGNANKTLQ